MIYGSVVFIPVSNLENTTDGHLGASVDTYKTTLEILTGYMTVVVIPMCNKELVMFSKRITAPIIHYGCYSHPSAKQGGYLPYPGMMYGLL